MRGNLVEEFSGKDVVGGKGQCNSAGFSAKKIAIS